MVWTEASLVFGRHTDLDGLISAYQTSGEDGKFLCRPLKAIEIQLIY